jgi:ATP-dependent RNA helicase DDX27
LKKTHFFDDFDDQIQTQNWTFKNPNVSTETFQPTKRKRKEIFLQESDSSFGELGLCKPLLKACSDLGFLNPTEIQEQTIPLILKGSDVLLCAKTGSGKTGAFSLPILHKLLHSGGPRRLTRAIVLTPTRELCQQTYSMIQNYTKYTGLVAQAVFGGANSANEQRQLQDGPEIVIGTPGRVLDHILNTKDISFEHVEYLVLDEADRLLDMGFTAELQAIVKELPQARQTVLASATMGEQVKDLVKLALRQPVRVGKEGVPDKLHQVIVRMREGWNREAVVVYIVTGQVSGNVIVFTKTKFDCHRMHLILQQVGVKSTELHGKMPQASRLKALEEFQNGDVDVLVATDLASRGLDLPVDAVVNMHIPEDITKLKHRIGRTARAGQEGVSISLCNEEERTAVRKAIKKDTSSLSLEREKLEKCEESVRKALIKIKEIFEEEQLEKEMRKAEMEANKTKNMIDHYDEIYNKPKKEWIKKEGDRKEKKKEEFETRKGGELTGKIMRHKLMLETYKNAAKGVKNIEKHIEKARKPKKSKNKHNK